MCITSVKTHVALIKELKEAVKTGKLYTYFNILRNILVTAASFHGYTDFSECIKTGENDRAVYLCEVCQYT